MAVTLLIMGVVVALDPTGSPTNARAAGGRAVQPQETFESTSPTPSASASPSEPVETISPSARTITIEPNPDEPIDFGFLGEVRGVIESDNPSCKSRQVVRIDQRLAESSDFKKFGTTMSRSNGRWAFVFDAKENADYLASVEQTASCAFAEAGPVEVKVRVLAFLGVSDTRVTSGEGVRFKTFIKPCGDHDRTMIELLRSRKDDDDDTENSTARNLDKDCRAVFTRRVNVTTIFRALWREQDNDHAAGSSDRIRVKVIV